MMMTENLIRERERDSKLKVWKKLLDEFKF
jgi:hypothetical protein